jgi:hypothetical protein
MLTLQKQQKGGYYTITLGYEKLIHKDIFDSLNGRDFIQTSAHNKLQKEYSPSVKSLQLVAGTGALWVVQSLYDKHKQSIFHFTEKTLGRVVDKLGVMSQNKSLSSAIVTILSSTFKWVEYLRNSFIEDYLKVEIGIDIIFAFLYLNKLNNITDTFCNLTIPFYILKRLDKYGYQKLSDRANNQEGRLKQFTKIVQTLFADIFLPKFLVKDNIKLNDVSGEQTNTRNILFSHLSSATTDIFHILEKWYMTVTQSMVLYSSLLVGVVVMQTVICKKIIRNKLTLEVNSEKFNKFLKKLLMYLTKNSFM